MDKESVTDQSAGCRVTARVKFWDIPIAPLQGANVGGGMSTEGGARPARRDGLCPRLLYVTASRSSETRCAQKGWREFQKLLETAPFSSDEWEDDKRAMIEEFKKEIKP